MGKKKRTLQELTIKDNFMFAAVMLDTENCRQLLELILEMPIQQVNVSAEKSIVYNPEYKGIRLDVIAEDAEHTHYNVEMQVQKKSLPRRSRYYHSQMDMEMLLSGADYEKLPGSYVIFICDYDPFDGEKYRYTVESSFKEAKGLRYDDGNYSIYLSTKGKNQDEEPKALVRFLEFVHADLEDSTDNFEDEFVERLQRTIAGIKASREMGARYMVFEEMLKEEYEEGKKEGKAEGIKEGIKEGKAGDILALLEDFGKIPEDLAMRIMDVRDLHILKRLLKLAARVESLDQFMMEMEHICPEK